MKIKELLAKDIDRSINGVVKAEQQDDDSVWQELDEFVVTRELSRHLDKYFTVYSESIDNPNDPDIAGKMGVWVSGFFGSGKSHFIKALSYLLGGREVSYNGQSRKAVEFFEDKVNEAMLLGNIRRSVAKETDVIIFNIDSKADQAKGRDAILAVFLKVLNERQGYSPDHPHIAHMERYLDSKGKYEQFKQEYEKETDSQWLAGRDSYMFNQDEIVVALSKTLGQSKEACHRWIDNAESDFSLTVENFAKWTRDYLDLCGPDHRILFFVDEIGQFIGQDGFLMLNLQTIVENLGVTCQGRAWVVVTSQEDIDKVLGSLSNALSNDFSKIQGRFKTRLSLSSANTDEVIQARLIEKKPEFTDKLKEIYHKNADILRNQLTFSNVGMTLRPYKSEDDFVRNYPFIPYQFQLLQKVFETIRRAGATGLHLSRGERSMLDAFQHAGKIAAAKDIGILVPLYWFYPSIESFLDTAVKRTIRQAGDNPSLDEFDVLILQSLFMIRYIDEIKGNIDNLVTLCLDEIDADRLALRTKIEEALQRLEKEHLIGRSGGDYFFLTNEERDISREIGHVELVSGAESSELGKIIFEEIYKDNKRHRYAKTAKDFDINRLCDQIVHGGKVDEGLIVSVITPFNDDYVHYDKAKCSLECQNEGGQVIICLPEQPPLGIELRSYLKTERYVSRKNAANSEVERILRERKEDNRQRKKMLIEIVREMLARADYYVAGQQLNVSVGEPIGALAEAIDYLINNTFNKMAYIEHPCNDPVKEVQAILRANDIGQQSLNLNLPQYNSKATAEVREYIDLCTKTSKQLILHDLITKRFSNRPYGWPDWETMLVLARLIIAGEIQFVMFENTLKTKGIYEQISKTSNWRKILIKQRRIVDAQLLEQSRKLGQELFGQMGPDNEDGLFGFFREHLSQWQSSLKEYKTLADTGNYPGGQEIADGLGHVSVLLNDKESYKFINHLKERREALLDFAEDFHDINTFYKSQRPTWERLIREYDRFKQNEYELGKDPAAAMALRRMQEILDARAPYGMIHEVSNLIAKVETINNNLIATYRSQMLVKVEKLLDELGNELEKAEVEAGFQGPILKPLVNIKESVVICESIAHLQQLENRAGDVFGQQVKAIAKHLASKVQPEKAGEPARPKPVIKPIVAIKSSSIVHKSYLETQGDVDEFIEKLKTKLSNEIANNNRIRVE
ncbi:MAG: BREX system P-loop protein BrxC [Phycisphaerae bacterium]|nr:BREX system P-loop protein BrxC [Phycisphaerae bacterium]